MCGIAGAVRLHDQAIPDRGTLAAMARCQTHRGPDDEGIWVGPGAGFAFRRLSVIDLAGGRQPMSSADGRVVTVFNGEIYNHHDLRAELEARGCRFATRSDTETLVHGFREWGDGLPLRLRGMFAFACWDTADRRLLLARDRMGKKPLHLLVHDGALWFASELKALRAVPGWDGEVDPEALDIFLSQQFIPAPWTIHRAVRKLPPGHRLTLDAGHTDTSPYWTPRFEPKERGSSAELQERLLALCREAVGIRLESEVPLGAFLSGGVDSSTVVALMAEALPAPVRTYTIGFEEEAYDERRYGRVVAERFGTEHHEYVVRPEVARDLPAILAQYDEPYADKSAVPSWYLAREAARDLTVVLTGDGADDIFAGYRKYIVGRAGRWIAALPEGLRGRLETGLMEALVAGRLGKNLDRAVRNTVFPAARSLFTPGFFQGRDKARLYRPEFASAVAGAGFGELVRSLHRETRGLPELLDRMLAVDINQYLAGDLLPKVDISSMAHSLEARSPFLDQEVVDFALRLPDRHRVSAGVPKAILKQAVSELLPPGIPFREKRGFSVPVNEWLAGELASLLRRLLVDDPAGLASWFDPGEMRRLVDEHTARKARHGAKLWALLCLRLWDASCRAGTIAHGSAAGSLAEGATIRLASTAGSTPRST